jgi:hypothetical protein
MIGADLKHEPWRDHTLHMRRRARGWGWERVCALSRLSTERPRVGEEQVGAPAGPDQGEACQKSEPSGSDASNPHSNIVQFHDRLVNRLRRTCSATVAAALNRTAVAADVTVPRP